jgi:hypothetical protein
MSPLSNDSTPDDELFVRYLLGQLSEEEAERLDELSIADDEVAWRLRAAEDDLVDAYVRGSLTDLARARFERVYLVTPKRRDKVRFAQSLVRALEREPHINGVLAVGAPAGMPTAASVHAAKSAAAADAAAGDATRPRWLAWLFPESAAGWTLTAVGALLAVVCGALLVQTARLRDDLATEKSMRASFDQHAQDLQRQLDAQKVASADTTAQLDRIRTQLAEATQQQSTATASRGSSLLTGAVALLLTPQTRAAGSAPAIALRPGAEGVPLALLLETDDFPRYQVAVKDPATNTIVWRSDRLAAAAVNHAPTVTVVLPARLLKAQHYALELSGLRAAGGTDVIGSYVVRIVQ